MASLSWWHRATRRSGRIRHFGSSHHAITPGLSLARKQSPTSDPARWIGHWSSLKLYQCPGLMLLGREVRQGYNPAYFMRRVAGAKHTSGGSRPGRYLQTLAVFDK